MEPIVIALIPLTIIVTTILIIYSSTIRWLFISIAFSITAFTLATLFLVFLGSLATKLCYSY
jgi:hypothetical protein